MLRNKKGAIEMSMTTIIVIVLGVTMLILGLAFVRDVYLKIGGISEGVFEEAGSELQGLGDVEDFLTVVPSQVKIKQGEGKGIGVVVYNRGEETIRIKVKAIPIKDEKLLCQFEETLEGESLQHEIISGGKLTLKLGVQDTKGDLRRTVCRVEVTGGQKGEQNIVTIGIQVI